MCFLRVQNERVYKIHIHKIRYVISSYLLDKYVYEKSLLVQRNKVCKKVHIIHNKKILLICVLSSVNLVSLAHGSTTGWVSSAILHLKSEDTHFKQPITLEQVSWIGASLPIGAFCGTL